MSHNNDSFKIKKDIRKTISIPVDNGTSNFGTFDSDLIQKLDHRHSFTEKAKSGFNRIQTDQFEINLFSWRRYSTNNRR